MSNNVFELSVIDSLLDKEIENIELRKRSLQLAIWQYLTVAEDYSRLAYIYNDGEIGFEMISFINFKMKFVYKFSVQKICSEMIDVEIKNVNLKTSEKEYKEYQGLIKTTFGYVGKYNMLSKLHDSTCVLRLLEDNKVFCEYTQSEYLFEYSALELIGHGKSVSDKFISVMLSFYYLSDDTELKDFIYLNLKEKVSLRKRNIIYEFNKYSIDVLRIAFGTMSRVSVFNGNFNFKWGDSNFTRKIIDAILIRCLFHLLILWVGVKKHNFIGGFEDCLVLKINKRDLIKEISMIAKESNLSLIEKVLDFITYPIRDSNADAALQPIFNFNECLHLPCFHIIESNIERNIMTLYARKEKLEFDKESNVFEMSMINSIEKNLRKYDYEKNFKIRISRKDQEYDFIIIDRNKKIILIAELRWMIQPADPREISRRADACKEKVEKVKTKKKFMEDSKKIFEQKLGLDDIDEYSIQGLIVLDGYAGEYTRNIDIPLITMEIFNMALSYCSDLKEVFNSIKSLSWLPKENEFFSRGEDVFEIGGYEFHIPGIRIINRDTNSYKNTLKSFFENFKSD